MHSDHLETYLNDHLGGSTAGIELARRTLANNEGTEWESTLRRVAEEIEEDRATLFDMIEAIGGSPDPVKRAVAWAGEKLARVKPNAALTSYSTLSRLIEFEGLMLGVSGKLALWRSVAACRPPELSAFAFEDLIARAERQRDDLERLRIEAARVALAAETGVVDPVSPGPGAGS